MTMRLLTVGVCAIFCISYNDAAHINSFKKQSNTDLVSVAVLFRHGDKTPTTSFPNDPFFDPVYWPEGYGELTTKGKTRQYNLGEWLRNRYSSFLPEKYSPKDVYVRSTDVDRTIMSALVNLAGLYPPKDIQVWDRDLLWQPIPVHTFPLEEDQILYMDTKCPKYDTLYEKVENSDYIAYINEEYGDFYRNISTLTGWNITNVHFFAQLQSVLYVYSNYNELYLPPWLDSIDIDSVEYLAGLHYAMFTFVEDLKRLGIGPFLDYLFGKLDEGINNAGSTPKFYMFSAHENNIAAVLDSLDLYDYKTPEFASALIWELRKNETGNHYVNLFYKRNSTEYVDQLELKECGIDCSYDDLKTFLEPVTIDMDSWTTECNS